MGNNPHLYGVFHICLKRKEHALLHPRNNLIPLYTHTRTHTHTHTHTHTNTCTHTHTHTHAQHVVGPKFHVSQYEGTEGETLVVRLSASVLTSPQVPPFGGSIEVDITAEDLPRDSAEFGKCYPSVLHLLQLCFC